MPPDDDFVDNVNDREGGFNADNEDRKFAASERALLTWSRGDADREPNEFDRLPEWACDFGDFAAGGGVKRGEDSSVLSVVPDASST
jgi:hypothetical protein